jgi:hypothetical protein
MAILDHRSLMVEVDEGLASFVAVGRLLAPEGDWRPRWCRFGCSPQTLGCGTFVWLYEVPRAYWRALAEHVARMGMN